MKCTFPGVGLADQMYEGTGSSVMVKVLALVCLN